MSDQVWGVKDPPTNQTNLAASSQNAATQAKAMQTLTLLASYTYSPPHPPASTTRHNGTAVP